MRTFQSLDEIQSWILSTLLAHGEEVQPRGMRTLEVHPVSFTLLNPRRRCVANAARRWNFPLAVGEFCWHVAGSNELEFIEYYVRRWRELAGDSQTISGSCYGYKAFYSEPGRGSQWERLIKLLRVDPHSRRAVLHFSGPEPDLDPASKDVACACSLQFMIRSGRLHAFTHMRSNDAILGLPYDVFTFTMLQEFLACELGLGLGSYSHWAASLHLYERHFKLAQSIVNSRSEESFEMPPMESHGQIQEFLELEARTRRGESAISSKEAKSLNLYWQHLLSVLDWHRLARQEGGHSKVWDRIPDNSPYSRLLQNMTAAPRPLPLAFGT